MLANPTPADMAIVESDVDRAARLLSLNSFDIIDLRRAQQADGPSPDCLRLARIRQHLGEQAGFVWQSNPLGSLGSFLDGYLSRRAEEGQLALLNTCAF